MVRQGAVSCGPATSQYEIAALVAAARRGHKDTVVLLLDRGADLESKDCVSAACVCCCATGRAGRHGQVRGRGDGGDASGHCDAIAGLFERWRCRGAMLARERGCDEVRCRAGLRRRSVAQRRLLQQHDVATRTRWSCCWTGVPTWRPRTA